MHIKAENWCKGLNSAVSLCLTFQLIFTTNIECGSLARHPSEGWIPKLTNKKEVQFSIKCYQCNVKKSFWLGFFSALLSIKSPQKYSESSCALNLFVCIFGTEKRWWTSEKLQMATYGRPQFQLNKRWWIF